MLPVPRRRCGQDPVSYTHLIVLYPGNVEDYLGYKEQQREQAAAINANLEIRRKQLQTFVDKNKAKASKATQAASKVKMLERLRPIEVERCV